MTKVLLNKLKNFQLEDNLVLYHLHDKNHNEYDRDYGYSVVT
jgi:hypothetical protein